MSPKDFNQRLQNGETWCILDVRENEELQICQLPNVLHIPLQSIPKQLDKISRNTPTIIVCHLGDRSQVAVHYLMQKGYENIYNLDGGMEYWSLTVDVDMPRY